MSVAGTLTDDTYHDALISGTVHTVNDDVFINVTVDDPVVEKSQFSIHLTLSKEELQDSFQKYIQGTQSGISKCWIKGTNSKGLPLPSNLKLLVLFEKANKMTRNPGEVLDPLKTNLRCLAINFNERSEMINLNFLVPGHCFLSELAQS